MKYGLSVIPDSDEKGIPYQVWLDEKNGVPSYRTVLKEEIDAIISRVFTWKQFLHALEQKGYKVKLTPSYTSVCPPGAGQFIRLKGKTLGTGYSEQDIKDRILYPKRFVKKPGQPGYRRVYPYRGKPFVKWTGIKKGSLPGLNENQPMHCI